MFNPMKITNIATIFTIIALLINPSTSKCKHSWEGFGVYLGALSSFNSTTEENQSAVLTKLYDDLKLRNFRTEYMQQFSTRENEYSIDCVDSQTCTWIGIHSLLAKLPEKSLFVTIWSPPHYMKNWLKQLKTKYERPYYYYIKNITSIVEKSFGLSIDKVSVANEPENIFATWDRCLMTPNQLCSIIQSYDDPLTSLCAENAWFKISKLYHSFSLGSVNCAKSCPIMTSHGYQASLNPFKHFGTVYYDLTVYSENPSSPVWITEVSSTRGSAQSDEMGEAIDMSINIVNYVGTTCVQRWYYWYAFTISPSGESLIWFDQKTNQLYFPKKYYSYRHFTQASFGSNDRLDCSTQDYYCLQFMPNGRKVYVNSNNQNKKIDLTCNLCCTTADNSYKCSQSNNLPSRSICSC